MVLMNKVVLAILVAPSMVCAVELVDVLPNNCTKVDKVEAMSQKSIEESKVALKETAKKMGANIVHLQEAKAHLVTTHDLPDMPLYISKGVAYKRAKP